MFALVSLLRSLIGQEDRSSLTKFTFIDARILTA